MKTQNTHFHYGYLNPFGIRILFSDPLGTMCCPFDLELCSFNPTYFSCVYDKKMSDESHLRKQEFT